MKKRKILVLFPVLGLLLTGCDFQEGLNKAKEWFGDNVVEKVKDVLPFIPKEEQKDEPKEDEGSHEEEKQIKRISVESAPESVAEGAEISASMVTVRVFYSDGTEETKAAEEVIVDTSVPGDAVEMIVKYGGKETATTIKVVAASEVIHVESIKYNTGSVYTIDVGATLQISIEVTPEDATDQSCTFTSSNEAIATVTNDGLVTGVSAGSVTIHIVSNDNPEAKKDLNLTIRAEAAALPEKTARNYSKLAANEALQNGEKINIAGAIGDKFYAMPQYVSGNNIKAKEVSLENGALAIEEAEDYTVVLNSNGSFSLVTADGKYLAATGGSSGNQLKAIDAIDERAEFNIAVADDGNTEIVNANVDRGSLCLNPNNGNPIFSCYNEVKYERYALYHNGEGQQGEVHVEGISFPQAEYEITKGNSLEISAVITPATATDKEVSYELNNVTPEGAVTLQGNTVTAVEVGTAELIATAHDGGKQASTKISVKEKQNPTHAGTLEDPYTVDDARLAIDNNEGLKGVYAKGIVSEIVTPYSADYKNVSFNISEDGSKEAAQLQGFRTKGTEAYPITSEDDVQVGDTVILKGDLKKYGDIYEFNSGNELVYLNRPGQGEKSIVEILSVVGPESVELNGTVALSEVTVMVKYDDGSEGKARVLGIELDTTTSGEKTAYVTIEGFEAKGEFTITVLAEAINYGTLEAPLSVAEALALIAEQCPESGNVTKEMLYCKGEVKSFEDKGNYLKNVYVTDGENTVLVYSINFSEGVSKDDVKVGSMITFHGYAKNYNGTLEFASNGQQYVYIDSAVAPVTPDPVEILSVTVPETIEQGETLALDKVALVVRMSDGSELQATATAVTLDTTEAGEAVVGTAYYKELSKEFTIKVVAKEVPPVVGNDAIFALGADGDAGHKDGTAADSYTEENNGKTLSITGVKLFVGAKDAKGNGCLKFGTSNGAGSFKIDLSNVTGVKQIIIKAAQYKVRTDCTVALNGGEAVTLSGQSDNGVYDELSYVLNGETELNVVFSGRAMVNEIVFLGDGGTPIEPPTETAILEVLAPSEIEQDAILEVSDVQLTIEMSDGTTITATPTGILLDTSTAGEAVVGTVFYDALSKEFTIKVVAKEVPPVVGNDAIFALGADGDAGHKDGTAADSYTEENNGKTLSITGVKLFVGAKDAKGNGCLKLGTGSAAGSFKIDLSNVTGVKQIIIKAAQYKVRTDCTVALNGGEAVTLEKQSDNGEYDELSYVLNGETELNVVFSGRAMVNEIVFLLG